MTIWVQTAEKEIYKEIEEGDVINFSIKVNKI